MSLPTASTRNGIGLTDPARENAPAGPIPVRWTAPVAVLAALAAALGYALAAVPNIELITLTHDLDRRMVVERSVDRVGGVDTIVHYNGTNRTSFLIPGPNQSDFDEDEIPAGERFYLDQVSEVATLE